MASETPSPLSAVLYEDTAKQREGWEQEALADAPAAAAVDAAPSVPDKEQQLAQWHTDLDQLKESVRRYIYGSQYQNGALLLRDDGIGIDTDNPSVVILGATQNGEVDGPAMENLKRLLDIHIQALGLEIATEVRIVGEETDLERSKLYNLFVAPTWVVDAQRAERAKSQAAKSHPKGAARAALAGKAEAGPQTAEAILIASLEEATTFVELKTAVEKAISSGVPINPVVPGQIDMFAAGGNHDLLPRPHIRKAGLRIRAAQASA